MFLSDIFDFLGDAFLRIDFADPNRSWVERVFAAALLLCCFFVLLALFKSLVLHA